MDYAQSLNYLYSLGNEVLTAKFDLKNITILLERLGHPEKTFSSVLIAGTNGKGSVSAMVESIARQAGHRTALYTSPHLVTIEERIQFCGQKISQADFARLATVIREASETLVTEGKLATVPTYFEQLTAIALSYFCECGAGLAILEVGLGGRLDATNAVNRIVSVVTAIDFDHEDILGHSIEQIAGEKAGIFVNGAQPIIGRQLYTEALAVLKQRSYDIGELPILVNQPTAISLGNYGLPSFNYRSSLDQYANLLCGLRGRHQADNAATAIEVAEFISERYFHIPREAIIRGLHEVRWPGRLELVLGTPAYLFDGSHNPAGAKTLRDYLTEVWHQPVTLMFGAMSDKDIDGMAAQLFSLPDAIIFTKVDEPRAATLERLRSVASNASCKVFFADRVSEAMAKAKEITPSEGLICVAGSLYLVGAVKRLMQN